LQASKSAVSAAELKSRCGFYKDPQLITFQSFEDLHTQWFSGVSRPWFVSSYEIRCGHPRYDDVGTKNIKNCYQGDPFRQKNNADSAKKAPIE
jgi:hypothetical protein